MLRADRDRSIHIPSSTRSKATTSSPPRVFRVSLGKEYALGYIKYLLEVIAQSGRKPAKSFRRIICTNPPAGILEKLKAHYKFCVLGSVLSLLKVG
jgi:hypothetical protein